MQSHSFAELPFEFASSPLMSGSKSTSHPTHSNAKGILKLHFLNSSEEKVHIELETCNTTVQLRKTTTCRIQSHIRHVVYRIITVYDSVRNIVCRGFTAIYLVMEGRIVSHISGFSMKLFDLGNHIYFKFPRDLKGSFVLPFLEQTIKLKNL